MSFPSSSSSASAESAEEKVAKFETFINDVLKDSLKQIFRAIEVVNDEITDLRNARDSIESMCELADEAASTGGGGGGGKPVKTRINVGCDYYMQANVDVRKFLVCVGLGYYVELAKDEALEHIRHRLEKLMEHENDLRGKGARVRAQITLALHCIQQLQGL